MNYQKIYDALVEKAKVRGLDKSQHEGYFEIHHIIPRCLGGSDEDSNLVMLTGREHYIAHMLLWKAFPENKGLQRAAWAMSAGGRSSKVNSRMYSAIQEAHRQDTREFMKGRYFKDLTGNKYERLTVVSQGEDYYTPDGLKYSRWNCICECGNETLVHGTSLSTGNTKSCGCLAVEARKNAKGNLGNITPFIFSSGEEHPNYGKELPEEIRMNISKALKAKEIKPWENLSHKSNKNHLSKWALADYYYDLWVLFEKCGEKKLSKAFNIINNDNTKPGTFAGMIREFSSGWIPTEDENWLEFRKREMND